MVCSTSVMMWNNGVFGMTKEAASTLEHRDWHYVREINDQCQSNSKEFENEITIQSNVVITRFNTVRYFIITETEAKYQLNARSIKGTSYIALTGMLWGVFFIFVRKVDCVITATHSVIAFLFAKWTTWRYWSLVSHDGTVLFKRCPFQLTRFSLGDWKHVSIAHVIIIIKSEVSTLPISIISWLCAWDVYYIIFCHLLHTHSGKTEILFSLLLCSLWWVQIDGCVLAYRSYSFVCI